MNRDDVIRMALEAGFIDRKESCPLSGESRFDEEICVGEYPVGEIVERFAALVAAKKDKQIAELLEALEAVLFHAERRIPDASIEVIARAAIAKARGEK